MSDALPRGVGTVVLVTGLHPALSCLLIWLRKRKPPRDDLIAAGMYYATLAISFLGIYFTSGTAVLFGCSFWILLAAGFPLALVLYTAGRPYDGKPLDENECEHCGYNLTLNTSGWCPECGKPTPKPTESSD